MWLHYVSLVMRRYTVLRPLRGYVLIEEIKEEGKTAGGIYTAEKAQDKPAKGRVLAMGAVPLEDQRLQVELLKVDKIDSYKSPNFINKTVAFNRWATKEVTDTDGKKYQLVAFGDLLAIYE